MKFNEENPYNLFSTVFNSTTNCYKYFWWLSILKILKENDLNEIAFHSISFKMLAQVWYPINYYKISLGKQDQLSKFVISLKKEFDLKENISENDLISFFEKNKNEKLIQEIIIKMMRYVPYRFIRPWVPESIGLDDGLVNRTIFLNHSTKNAIYEINSSKNSIKFNKKWLDFIRSNYKLIEDFTLFNLLKFVEKNNPEASNISIKITKPSKRNLLLANNLWKSYMKENVYQNSVFENINFASFKSFSIDHYLPWSYVTHDKIWNLHPVTKKINSSKSNRLPNNSYLKRFCILQYNFVQFIGDNYPKKLSDYNALFQADNHTILALRKDQFTEILKRKFTSHIQLASNMGFETNWTAN